MNCPPIESLSPRCAGDICISYSCHPDWCHVLSFFTGHLDKPQLYFDYVPYDLSQNYERQALMALGEMPKSALINRQKELKSVMKWTSNAVFSMQEIEGSTKALEAIGRWFDTTGLDWLTALRESSPDISRQQIIWYIDQTCRTHCPRSAFDYLAGSLEQSDPEIRQQALCAIAHVRPIDAGLLDAFIRTMFGGDGTINSPTALVELCLSSPRSTFILQRALAGPPRVVVKVLSAMAFHLSEMRACPTSAEPCELMCESLIRCLRSSDVNVRESAVSVAGKLISRVGRIVTEIANLLNDDQIGDLAAIALALNNYYDPRCVDRIAKRLRNGNSHRNEFQALVRLANMSSTGKADKALATLLLTREHESEIDSWELDGLSPTPFVESILTKALQGEFDTAQERAMVFIVENMGFVLQVSARFEIVKNVETISTELLDIRELNVEEREIERWLLNETLLAEALDSFERAAMCAPDSACQLLESLFGQRKEIAPKDIDGPLLDLVVVAYMSDATALLERCLGRSPLSPWKKIDEDSLWMRLTHGQNPCPRAHSLRLSTVSLRIREILCYSENSIITIAAALQVACRHQYSNKRSTSYETSLARKILSLARFNVGAFLRVLSEWLCNKAGERSAFARACLDSIFEQQLVVDACLCALRRNCGQLVEARNLLRNSIVDERSRRKVIASLPTVSNESASYLVEVLAETAFDQLEDHDSFALILLLRLNGDTSTQRLMSESYHRRSREEPNEDLLRWAFCEALADTDFQSQLLGCKTEDDLRSLCGPIYLRRRAAKLARRLGCGGSQIEPKLVNALQSSDGDLRSKAGSALISIAYPQLDTDVRLLKILDGLRYDPAIPCWKLPKLLELERVLGHRASSNPQVFRAIWNAAESQDRVLRTHGIGSLGYSCRFDEKIEALLLSRLEHAEDWHCAAASLQHLGHFTPSTASALAKRLPEDNAIKALGKLRPANRQIVDTLVKTLSDTENIPISTITELSELGKSANAALPRLNEILESSPEHAYSRSILEAIGQIATTDKRVWRGILAYLESGETQDFVIERVCSSLILVSEQLIEKLLTLLAVSTEDSARESYIHSLRNSSAMHLDVIEALLGFIGGDADRKLEYEAIKSLEEILFRSPQWAWLICKNNSSKLNDTIRRLAEAGVSIIVQPNNHGLVVFGESQAIELEASAR